MILLPITIHRSLLVQPITCKIEFVHVTFLDVNVLMQLALHVAEVKCSSLHYTICACADSVCIPGAVSLSCSGYLSEFKELLLNHGVLFPMPNWSWHWVVHHRHMNAKICLAIEGVKIVTVG